MAPRREATADSRIAKKAAKKDAGRRNTVPQRKKAANQDAFLAAFREVGNIYRAAQLVKMDRTQHYRWLDDPEYRARFADASDDAVDSLETEARRRAVEGVDEPAGWFQGTAGGVVRKYSDTLLIFLLKGARPEKYRDRLEHTGKDGAPIEVAQLTTAERAARVAAILAKAEAR
jgi:hypothetical protein